ncbi:MAG TPA: hypothetical protein GXX51_02715 [Firmicutes bacterium]|nr:hypothetical protein [Bacillota bacterium]
MVPDKRSFLFGIGIGALAVLVIVAGLGYTVLSKGVSLAIDSQKLAASIRTQVEEAARAELPVVAEGLKKSVPAQIAKNPIRLGDSSIRISNIQISLPSASLRQLENELNRLAEKSVLATLDTMNFSQLADSFGAITHDIVRETLRSELAGKTVNVVASKWMAVPVVVHVR